MPESSLPLRRRRSFWFGMSAALLTAVTVGGAFYYILTGHPYRAVWFLAGGLGLLGLMRALWPGDPWFGSRSRLADVLAYWAIAVGLLVLSPWVALVPH